MMNEKSIDMKTEPTEKLREKANSLKYNFGIIHSNPKLILEESFISGVKYGQSNPKIKQLEWEDTDMWYFKSKTSLGLGYSITEIKGTYIVHFGDAPISWEKSLESAKDAAQRDFEKRIKDCLE